MASINNMVKRITGLAQGDVTTWEYDFIDSIDDQTESGTDCAILSAKQVEIVERIFTKHFAA